MANTPANVIRGAAQVSVGPWVTAKGAGSLVDMGYTFGAASLLPKLTYHEVEPQQHLAPIKAWITKRNAEAKVICGEADADKLRLMFMNPAANFTGTPPAITGLVDADAVDMYFQVSIVTKGTGSTGVRTMTIWRCVLTSPEAIEYKKDGEQLYKFTLTVLYEETGTGADTLMKVVDA